MKATIEHEIATGTFDYAKHFPDSRRAKLLRRGSGTDIRTALLAYVDTLANQLQPETVDEYRHDAEIVADGLNGETLGSITRAKVRAWLATRNLSKKRIDNLLIPLRGALEQAVEDEEIESNPLAGFKVRRVEAIRDTIDPFTPAEVKALAATELGYLWEFWAWSGLRSGEIIGLQWDDLGADLGSARIERAVRVGREKVTKTAAGTRLVVLLPAARAALGRIDRAADEPHIFRNPNTGKRWHEDRGLARAFKKACEAGGVRYRYPYQLRHTYATWALSSGENPKWAATQMGHKDMITFFRVYAKWMPTLDPGAGSKMVAAVKSKAA